jgi:two-component system, OmpR family, response regulator
MTQGVGNRPDLRVLVVDDDPEIGDHMDALLRDWQFEPRVAINGRDAIAINREWKPHVAVVDLRLPDMIGTDLLQELRSAHSMPSSSR